MKIIIVTIIINFLFSQGNYQILNSPSSFKEIFKDNQVDDIEYSFFHTSFPAQIDFYSIDFLLNNIFNDSRFKKNKYKIYLNFESLDYGILQDNSNNHSFTANENLIKIKIINQIDENIKAMIKIGFLESGIDQYHSNAVLIDAILYYRFSNNIVNAKIENFGGVMKKYTDSNIDLPSVISLSYTKFFKPIEIIINYEYDLNLKEDLYSIASKFNINDNFKLYFGTNSNKKSLIYGNYIEELISGISTGMAFKYSDYIFYLAIQNMGPAGYSTSISFKKIIL